MEGSQFISAWRVRSGEGLGCNDDTAMTEHLIVEAVAFSNLVEDGACLDPFRRRLLHHGLVFTLIKRFSFGLNGLHTNAL